MGKSIKSECVIQILSRSQKHEQVLKFPTHILLVLSSRVTAHKWFDAAWGPAAVGGRIIFSSLQWPWPADWAIPFSQGRSGSAEPTDPWPRESTLFMLCWSSPQSAQQQAICWLGCELLPASYLTPKLWLLVTGHIKRAKRKEAKCMEFQEISFSSLSHFPYGQPYMWQTCHSVNQTEAKQGSCEYWTWDGMDIAEAVLSTLRCNGKTKGTCFFSSVKKHGYFFFLHISTHLCTSLR